MLATRIAACWRRRERYVLRDTDGNEITVEQGRAICAEQHKIATKVRQGRRRLNTAKNLKKGTSRRSEESTKAAPASGSSTKDATARKIA